MSPLTTSVQPLRNNFATTFQQLHSYLATPTNQDALLVQQAR